MVRDLWERFGDWVDSFGRDAGDQMVLGVIVAAVMAGLVCLGVAIALESSVLLLLGFAITIGHILFAMATL